MVAERPGLRVPGAWDGFELAVRAALGQQLTIVDTSTFVERIVKTFGQSVEVRIPGLSHVFPQPDILVEANLEELSIPSRRSDTIRCLARAVLDRKLTFNSHQSSEGRFAALRTLPNMNEGTVSYIAMRSLGEPDAFPYTDIGLRRAFGPHGRAISPEELLGAFEKFKPWSAYAAMHLGAAAKQAVRCLPRPRSRFAGMERIKSRLPIAVG
jgi:AraC family transcriptional regulator, regulatory protein of adaptative response / DNA-3-methyladenine glycosylase II